ncbi:MAG TPA: DUF2231 domain-containing protein [Acidimicrobiales bacterium]|nr:DUF2231 domain-containing protein [Acidimicrobiales bacterium]
MSTPDQDLDEELRRPVDPLLDMTPAPSTAGRQLALRLALDLAAWLAGLLLALAIRFGLTPDWERVRAVLLFAPLLVVLQALIGEFAGGRRRRRTNTLDELVGLAGSVMLATGAAAAFNAAISDSPVPQSVPIAGGVLALLGMVAVRSFTRLLAEERGDVVDLAGYEGRERPGSAAAIEHLGAGADEPFHLITVTVAVGAWVSSILFDIGSRSANEAFIYSRGAYWLIAIGLAGAASAAAFRMIDALRAPAAERRSLLVQAGLYLAVVAAFAASFVTRHGGPWGEVSIGLIAVSVVALAVFVVAAWRMRSAAPASG